MAGKGVVVGSTHIEDFQKLQHVSIIRLGVVVGSNSH